MLGRKGYGQMPMAPDERTTNQISRCGAIKFGSAHHNADDSKTLIATGKVMMDGKEVEVTVIYDPTSHTIQWVLKGVPDLYSGKVYFSVIVNKGTEISQSQWWTG